MHTHHLECLATQVNLQVATEVQSGAPEMCALQAGCRSAENDEKYELAGRRSDVTRVREKSHF